MAISYLFINVVNDREILLISLGFIVMSIILVSLVFVRLSIKNRQLVDENYMEERVDKWISEAVLEEDVTTTPELAENLKDYFLKKSNQQFIINKLISICKNLSGTSLDKIIYLYEEYGFRENSLRKFRSRKWHKKARGIYELYMMNQRDMEDEIKKFTNSDNEFIRIEAQTAIVCFKGFEGLSFLDSLTKPITAWHQLKLVEQLNTFTSQPINGIEAWLKSDNPYVVMFALKLVAIFQQLHVHDQIIPCLGHPLEKIRTQAIDTITRVANDKTAQVLTDRYNRETTFNQCKILLNLKQLAEESERKFLLEQLGNTDDNIKLIASEILAANISDGLDLLEQKANAQPLPYRNIYQHAKRAVA